MEDCILILQQPACPHLQERYACKIGNSVWFGWR